jgi:predicted aspartyl protease
VGYVYCELKIRGEREKEIKALVDTGASYIVLDPKTIQEIKPTATQYEVEVILADKRRLRTRLYLAEAEAVGRRGPVFIAELETPTPLLGVFALETLGLKPNPATGKLEIIGPEGGYLL